MKAESTAEQRERFVREEFRKILIEQLNRLIPKWEETTGLYCDSFQTKYMLTRWGTCNSKAKRIFDIEDEAIKAGGFKGREDILHSYSNGNHQTVIFKDGTRYRETFEDDADHFTYRFAENADVKITNYCNAGCPYCHENSSVNGKHAELLKDGHLLPIFTTWNPGSEIAIGGGNALAHPDIVEFTKQLTNIGAVCNLTVNQKHIWDKNLELMIKEGYVKGIGISLTNSSSMADLNRIRYLKALSHNNVVLHVIAGIFNEKDKHYRVLSEIKIHRTLRNKYICKYEHSFEDDQAIYIVMEYCEKKSLDDYLKTRKSFTEYETRYYMFQVLLGLKYLRRKKVIHRDLTLANLFLKDYKTIKIGDFGLSYIETENEEKPGLMCGTQGYFTPESLQTKYSYKTDIFCFGVCIYHMMTGLTLFKDSISSFETIKKGEIKYDEKTLFSKECKDLFEQIFVFENKRIDLDELFIHPFFNEGIGLIDVDFPNYFDEKMTKKDFEEKIKILEQNVIMTEVSPYPKKNDNLYSSKNHNDNDGISNLKKNVRFNEFNTDNNRINMHPIKKKSNKNVTINLNNNLLYYSISRKIKLLYF